MADIVTPLLQTFLRQGEVAQQQATAVDTHALAQQRMTQNMLSQLLLQRQIDSQRVVQNWAQQNANDPRLAALAFDPADSQDMANEKQLKRMQLMTEGQQALAGQLRQAGNIDQAEKVDEATIKNLHWYGYVSRAAMQQKQETNRQVGASAGAGLQALESGQTADPAQTYGELQALMPADKFNMLQWNKDEDGNPIDGPLTRLSLKLTATNQISPTKQAELANAYRRQQPLADWRAAQARLANDKADAIAARNREGIDTIGSTGTSDGATAPGGPGSTILTDPNTGQRYMQNRDGTAYLANDDGTWTRTSANQIPKNAVKAGNIGTAGSRENVFNQRVIMAATQASKDLANVVQMPTTVATGMFGGRKQGPGLLDATKEVLANTVTGDEAQMYNAAATGFKRSLAAIEAVGLMPSGQLTDQMDNVILKQGDSNFTKLTKLAQIRQIIEAGMENIEANPRVSDSEKAKAKNILESVEKSVPFTVADVIKLKFSPESLTLKDLLKKGQSSGGGVTAASPAATPAGATETKYLGDVPVNKINGMWTNSKTGEVWKGGKWQQP